MLTAVMIVVASSGTAPAQPAPDQDTETEVTETEVTETEVTNTETTDAEATDTETPGAEAQVTVIPGVQLGLDREMLLDGADIERAITFAVPAGTAPRELTGEIRSPVAVGRGYIEALGSDGRLLGTAEIPDLAGGARSAPFAINLVGTPVVDGRAEVRLVLRPLDRLAVGCGPGQLVTLTALAVGFDGTPARAATTVADFFPSMLARVDLVVDPVPTDAEKQAALELTAALVALYRGSALDVAIVPVPRTAALPVGGTGLIRTVVLRDGGEPGVSVRPTAGDPVLLLEGSGVELIRQTGVLDAGLLDLVQVPAARAIRNEPDLVEGKDTLSFRELGASASVSVLGTGQLFVGIPAGSFARSTPGSMQVHLRADYTPVVDGDNATLSVSAGDSVVYSQILDSSGRVDANFPVPSTALGRTVGLSMTVTYRPEGGCTPHTPRLQFTVDPSSTVSVSGNAPPSGGFGAIPDAMSPTFQVAFDPADPQVGGWFGLSLAARTLAAMQTTALGPLRPLVTGFDEAADSDSGALIIANTATLQDASIPLALGSEGPADLVRGSDGSGQGGTAIDTSGGVGSVQVVADGDRTVVAVTTSGPWSLVEPALVRLSGGRWSETGGDVVAAGATGEAVGLTLLSDGPQSLAPRPGTDWRTWMLVSIIAIVAAGVLVTLILLLRRRSRIRPRP